ncbi:MAG: AbrB/MazE/SpoVT family DNA-binding domain-containing protein [Candidatus Goldbacteria bacterium]|nr:AbrB/MazE/SpoVT family DNA-binding domain-containing protein [Candidatus Goldiibacteriota bacterium]
MTTTVVTTKGQIVIPSKMRKKLKIKKGTKLYIEEKEDGLLLKPITSEYFKKIAGILQTRGKLSNALLKEREKDREKES